MDTLKHLKSELKSEYETTRRFFERFPENKNDYSPHDKSMKMMPLAAHISEVFGWPKYILDTSELDFGKNEYNPPKATNKEDLLNMLDNSYKSGLESLEAATEEQLEPNWAIKMNGKTLMEWSKYGAIRHALNQATHHRAQLGVYYRLNDIPLPESYGPSADTEFK
ncbi:damage-inducible protein DinB [Chryseobacterium sp. POL2]|uniref:DinB family protein n=1 Tax=Chryseobacterium sp. POL2 TaxID=2713414 RepID=UPI0013E20219|nr:DinB family protein [Chryseobacterium sp. POL2]QIG90041.1 damage-inducible protein DinB [Chryseobacterium sp. POL2]